MVSPLLRVAVRALLELRGRERVMSAAVALAGMRHASLRDSHRLWISLPG